jgi:hypothetical protein
MDAELIAAAQFERDRRAKTYPDKIKNGGDAERLCIDFQCWVAIAEWVETDRFFSFAGGAEPERDDAPIVSWPLLEEAAKKACHSIERKLASEGWFDGCEPTAASLRRGYLVRIHRAIQLRRESIDKINAGFSARRTQEIAA